MTPQCPHCGGSQVQSFATVHAGGTQAFTAKHSVVMDNGERGHGSSHGVAMTGLAAQCAPPAPPPPWFLAAYGVGATMLYLTFQPPVTWSGLLFSAAGFGIGWVLQKSYRTVSKEYTIAKRDWPNTWLCNGCGRAHVRG